MACGFANAKNSYGGYVGDRLFYGMLSNIGEGVSVFAVVSGLSGRSSELTTTYEMCVKAGVIRRVQL